MDFALSPNPVFPELLEAQTFVSSQRGISSQSRYCKRHGEGGGGEKSLRLFEFKSRERDYRKSAGSPVSWAPYLSQNNHLRKGEAIHCCSQCGRMLLFIFTRSRSAFGFAINLSEGAATQAWLGFVNNLPSLQ